MYFKNCKHMGGLNDKAWIGPRERVLALHRKYNYYFLTKPVTSTEVALLTAVRDLRLDYKTVDIPMSDARSTNGTVCWKRFYLCRRKVLPMCIIGGTTLETYRVTGTGGSKMKT